MLSNKQGHEGVERLRSERRRRIRPGRRSLLNGRQIGGLGTVFFGLFSRVGDHRLALFYAALLFLPAAAVALLLPEPPDEPSGVKEAPMD